MAAGARGSSQHRSRRMAAARHSVKSTVLVRRPPLTVVLVWLINDWCLVVPVWLCLCVLAWVNVIGCD